MEPGSEKSSLARVSPQSRPRPVRYFYSAAALLVLVLVFWGFQHFYFHGKAYPGRELTPPIRSLIIAHGMAMLLWVILLQAQTALIAMRKHKLHMMLGKAGAGLAVIIFLLGYMLAIAATRVNPPDQLIWNLTPRQFLVVPLFGILQFAIFVAIGIWYRRKPNIHRPMMLLATLAALSAGLDRIDPIRELYSHSFLGGIFGPFFSALAIGLALFVIKWALTRSFDRAFALGLLAQILIDAIIMRLATTGLWAAIAGALVG